MLGRNKDQIISDIALSLQRSVKPSITDRECLLEIIAVLQILLISNSHEESNDKIQDTIVCLNGKVKEIDDLEIDELADSLGEIFIKVNVEKQYKEALESLEKFIL
jgi:hypothetical protein